MTNTFDAMMQEIAQDYAAALTSNSTDANGQNHWRDVVFAHVMGFRPLMLYVSVPPAKKPPPPLVVFIHGGGWMLGHPMVTNPVYAEMDIFGNLLRAGFAVAKISYRLSHEGRFPVPLHDCKAAVRFLRNHAATFGVDPQRIAVMGDSAGGHLAALIGLTGDWPDVEGEVGETAGSSAVQAAIDWFGPTQLLTMRGQAIPGGIIKQDDPNSPESWMVGGPIQEMQAASILASPISYVTPSAPPFLIQHGTLDRLVPIKQSEILHAALLADGVDSTLKVIEGADHCFWGADRSGIMPDVIAFLRRVFPG